MPCEAASRTANRPIGGVACPPYWGYDQRKVMYRTLDGGEITPRAIQRMSLERLKATHPDLIVVWYMLQGCDPAGGDRGKSDMRKLWTTLANTKSKDW